MHGQLNNGVYREYIYYYIVHNMSHPPMSLLSYHKTIQKKNKKRVFAKVLLNILPKCSLIEFRQCNGNCKKKKGKNKN